MRTRKFTFLILLLSVLHQLPAIAQNTGTPFTSHSTEFVPPSASIASFTVSLSGNKVLFDWSVSDNQSADLFELEKSSDGKNFSAIAMIFGTDKANTDAYQYYEKAGKGKLVYRVKIIRKDKTVSYSAIQELTEAR